MMKSQLSVVTLTSIFVRRCLEIRHIGQDRAKYQSLTQSPLARACGSTLPSVDGAGEVDARGPIL